MEDETAAQYLAGMPDNHEIARLEFARMTRWIVVIALVIGIAGIATCLLSGNFTFDAIVGVVSGTLVFVALAWGLHALDYLRNERSRRSNKH